MQELPLVDWILGVDPDGPTPVPTLAGQLAGRRIPVRVPGGVFGDLQDAGLIEDPFVDDREFDVAWASRTDWCYDRLIDVPEGFDRVDLVFDGIDTVASVRVDGAEVGSSRNMYRSYRYLLPAAGRHHVAVHLVSAYTEAEALRDRLGQRPGAYAEPFNFVRKMACSFGWDWGPTLVGAGLWREVRLEAWNIARISRLRPLVDVVDGTGRLRVLVDVERADPTTGGSLRVDVLLDGEVVGSGVIKPGRDDVEIGVEVEDVRVWQPVGYGRPDLYDFTVQLHSADGVIDQTRRRIGFRSIEIDRGVDETGSGFLFRVNSEPVLVKGVNWIPDDVVPGRMTRDRYARRLTAAVAANVNLIRVWGGGIYESDDFYDLCDELGLLVWQDFPFACAAYPEEAPLRGEVLAEASENVARLCGHPSLVLWNGNNENLWLHEQDRWADREGGDLSWGERYYLHDLPAVLATVDPSRPYTAGSPWSGSWEHEPNNPDHQTFHSWDVWNQLDYTHYRDSAPRFVAEFGWQAPPAWTTLREAISDDPITPDSPGVQHHQKAIDGNDKLARGLAPHYPVPTDVHAWHYLTQLTQVKAIETGVRHWRSHWPHTAGTVLWQLNDIWPVISWAAIDGAGRLKPLYHALREVYADQVLTIEPVGDGVELGVLNDSPQAWAGDVRLRRMSDRGSVLAEHRLEIEVEPRTARRIALPAELTTWADPTSELLVADLDGHRAVWYGCEPRDAQYTAAEPVVAISTTDDGMDIGITASTVLRDLLVQPDRMHPDAIADRGFVTLLPGESVVIRVRCGEPLDADLIDRPHALTWLDRVIADRMVVGPPSTVHP